MTTLIPTYRGAVNAWECDLMGHMNVQFYVGKSIEALGYLRAALGLDPETIRRRRLTLIPAGDRIQFKRELRAGDIFVMASGVRGVRDGRIDTHTEIRNIETGEIAAIVDRELTTFDTEGKTAIALPGDVAARAAALAERMREMLPQKPPPQGPVAPHFADQRNFETYRGSINKWELDEHGIATPRFHIHRFSAAMSGLTAKLGFTAERRRVNQWGMAALDYRIEYHRPLGVGIPIQVVSGVLEVRNKVFRIYHHLIECEPTRAITSIEIVIAMFDLAARRAMTIPDEIRERAAALCPPPLTP